MNLFSRKKPETPNKDFDFKKVNESKSVLESTITTFLDQKSNINKDSNDNENINSFDTKKNILETQLKTINNKNGEKLLNTLNRINSIHNPISFKQDDIWNISELNNKINESCDNLYQFINDLNPYTLKEDYKMDGIAQNEWNIPKLLNHKQGEMLFEHLGFIRRSVFMNEDSLWDLKKLKDKRLIKYGVYINNKMVGFVDNLEEAQKCAKEIMSDYLTEYTVTYNNYHVYVKELLNGYDILVNYNMSLFSYDKIVCSVRHEKIIRI